VLAPPGHPASVLTRPDDPTAGAGPVLASPGEVADQLNRMFPFDQADQYFTLVYAILEPAEPGPEAAPPGPAEGARRGLAARLRTLADCRGWRSHAKRLVVGATMTNGTRA